MARNRKKRRQQHGSAWHWKQTDSWYYTEPGTKKRVPLFDENGERIRGKENRETARLALARIKLEDELTPSRPPAAEDWTVARVCDVYLADLHMSANPEWASQVEKWLNDFCSYCGALSVNELKKKQKRKVALLSRTPQKKNRQREKSSLPATARSAH